jgi:glycosyltransferase involved in cell wall biosynthesis
MVQTPIISNIKGGILTPLVSVIIPCYNQAHFLADAINSLKAQTIEDWECIIVNDGSNDNTAAVAEKLAQTDQRIQVINQLNKGLSGARNSGLDQVQGQYIQFLDADDIIEPEKFKIQTKQLDQESEPALSFSDYRCCAMDDLNKPASRDNFSPPEFIMENPLKDLIVRWETQFSIPPHCFLFDARFFSEYGIKFDETLANHEDWDCWMQIFRLRPIVRRVPQKFAIYRLHGESMCANPGNREKMWLGYKSALQKQRTLSKNDPEMLSLLNKKLREMQKSYGMEPLPLFWKRLVTVLIRIYRKNVPWSIQKAISKLKPLALNNFEK